MTVKQRSLEEIRRLGYEVLARELGPVDFIRFVQQFGTGSGNYTEERHLWLDPLDGATLAERIQERRGGATVATQNQGGENGPPAERD
jgi:hypothetical protein